MSEYREGWLPHLKDSIPNGAYGYTLSMYSVALEGWRRGLTLKFVNSRRSKAHTLFKLSNGNTEHTFSVSRGDAVPREAIKICIDKSRTKEYLINSGVPTPVGKSFDKNVPSSRIVSYASTLKYPLVIKPTDGTGGKGVVANIKNAEEFKKGLDYVRETLNFRNIIVEEHFTGDDYRVYVMDNKVVGAIKRVPANVIGDGVNTIRTLLKMKNKKRNLNPALYRRPIRIDIEMKDFLASIDYTLESIPHKNEVVYLRSKNNVSTGGESIDATDDLSDEIKQIAINAANAIPGLVQCGVDLMVNLDLNRGVVIEINSRPHITAQLFPYEGVARDIPKAIIDYYFPETTTINHTKPLYYFGFNDIWSSFRRGLSKEVTVIDCPKGEQNAIKLTLSGKPQKELSSSWIRKQVSFFKLQGFIDFYNNKTVIVVGGEKKSILKFRDVLKNEVEANVNINDILVEEYKSPIKVGFKIIEAEKTKIASKKVNSKVPKYSKKKRKFYEKEYYKVINSTSWKLTKPLRIIGRLFK